MSEVGMNPGRELDELIVEKIMGMDPHWGIPPYSTKIGAAWEVVERIWATIIPKTAYGVYRFQLDRLDTGRYVCQFAADEDGDFSTHSVGEADTAPVAICLAALRVVEMSRDNPRRKRNP